MAAAERFERISLIPVSRRLESQRLLVVEQNNGTSTGVGDTCHVSRISQLPTTDAPPAGLGSS